MNNVDHTGHAFGAVIGGFLGGIFGGISAAINGKSIGAGIITGAVTGFIIGGLCDGTTLSLGAIAAVTFKGSVVAAGMNVLNQYINYEIDNKAEKINNNGDKTTEKTSNSFMNYYDFGETLRSAITTATFVPLSVSGGALVNSAFIGLEKNGMDTIGVFLAEFTIGGNITMMQGIIDLFPMEAK